MSEIASAYVRIRPEMSGFKAETERGVKAGFGGVAKIIAGLGIGAAVAKGLKVGWDEMAEGAKVSAQTAAVIKSTGGAANVTTAQIQNLAAATLKKSGIDDEASQVAENMLLTFTGIHNEVGRGNDIFNRASDAVINMDVAMTHGNTTAESLRGTSILVGKALNDPVKGMTALRRVGVSLDEQQQKTVKSLVAQGKTMDAQKLILRELNKEFGGSAEALGNTLPGKLNILRETFRNDMAAMLAGAAPTLTKIIGWAGVAMPIAFRTLALIVHAVVGQIKGALDVLAPVLQPIISKAQEFVYVWQRAGSDGVFLKLRQEIEAMSPAAKVLAVAVAGIAAAFLLMAAPVTTLVALGVALDVLYRKNAAFRDFVNQAWATIRATVTAVVTYLQGLWAQYGATIVTDARATFAALSAIVQTGLDWIKGFWQRNGAEIARYAKVALEDVKTIVRTALALVRGYWDRFGGETIALVKAQWNMIKGVVQGAIIVVKNVIKLALDLIHGNWSAAWTDLVNIVKGALQIIVSQLRGYATIALTAAKGIGRAILMGITASLSFIGLQVVNALKGIASALVAAGNAAYQGALDIGRRIVDGLVDGVKSLPGRLGDALKSGVGGAYGATKHFLGISSPSKKAHDEIGVPIARGIIDGFLSGIGGLKPAMTSAVGGAVKGASAAVKGLSAGSQSAIAAIVQAASRYGVDPAALISVAMHESGLNAGAVGDHGTSFGLFQLHKGGALGSMNPKAALDALTNALVAAKALAGLGGRGLSGSAAVSLLSRGFERPANPAGEIADAMSHYRQALSYVGRTSAAIVNGAAGVSAAALIRMQPAILRDRQLGNSLLPTIGATVGNLAKKAAASKNIGEGAKTYLEQEETLLELAYSTLRADLAKARGPARAKIEAAMESVHRKIGRVLDAIADAVIVTGEALLPDKLRARMAALQSRFKAVSDLATVLTGDALERYQAALLSSERDQRDVLMRELDALKARLSGSKGRQRAAIQAELTKVRGALSAVNDQIMQSLESAVQATQARVSNVFGSIKSALDAQFDAATQAMLNELGKQFFQGSLTPAEATLQAYQTAKSQAALTDAYNTAASELAQALSQSIQDPADIATKRAALAAAQEAIKVDHLQAAATESRTKADQAYAAAAAKLQADRQALEQQMNDQLDALIASVLNGTGSISDLQAIATQYGVTIDTKAIPQMADLASATKTLAAEFRKLEAWIRKQTGSSGVVAGPTSSITQSQAFGTVLDNAFKAALSGQAHIGGLATGGLVRARPGGTVLRIAEGGEDEFVTPASRMANFSVRGVRDIVGALSPLSALEAMHRTSLAMLDELRRQTDILAAPSPVVVGVDPNQAASRAKR